MLLFSVLVEKKNTPKTLLQSCRQTFFELSVFSFESQVNFPQIFNSLAFIFIYLFKINCPFNLLELEGNLDHFPLLCPSRNVCIVFKLKILS